MTTCPRCHRPNPRAVDVESLHHAVGRTLLRASEMTVADARDYMAVNLIRAGLELRGFCAECVLLAQTCLASDAGLRAVGGAVEQAEQAMQAATAGGPLATVHLCRVIPLFPRRDLLDIGAKFDSERKKP